MPHGQLRRTLDLFAKESVVACVITINAVVIFLDAFPTVPFDNWLLWVDQACILFFVVEALVKTQGMRRFRAYWRDGWNKLDFIVVVISLPLLASPFVAFGLEAFAIILLLRLLRLLRFLRLFRFIPDADRLFAGVKRALRASMGVFLILVLFNVIFGVLGTLLYGGLPEAEVYFGNPLRSMYTMFKVFTIEGWFEVPERLVALGVDGGTINGMRAFFTAAVMLGGLLGLSIANAVFVDEMVADNTDELERKVDGLHDELRALRAELQQRVG